MMKTMQHKGRTGLVTGATGGLGEAQSEALACARADVLMLDIQRARRRMRCRAACRRVRAACTSSTAI